MALFGSQRQQPTVAATKTNYVAIVFAIFAGLIAAWAINTLMVAHREAEILVQQDKVPMRAPAAAPAPVAAPKPAPAPAPQFTPEQAEVLAQQVQHAQELRAKAQAQLSVQEPCDEAISRAGISLPEDFQVLAAGAYGGRDLQFRIDQSGHNATQLDVVVNSPGTPVALMLGAYEPTIWNLSWTPGTHLVAVYVGGYHSQRIGGLPRDLPLITSSYEERKTGSGCPYFYIGGEGGRTSVDEAAVRVFGRPVDKVFKAGRNAGGTIFVGAAGQLGPMRTAPPGDYRDNLVRPSGREGLDQAIQLGQLRRAGPGDAALWAQAMAQRKGRAFDASSDEQLDAPPYNLYIVTGPFVYPSGLNGANSVMFLVPPGVPTPRGDPGHSPVYLMR
jgi:hypothetical protein